MGSFTAASLGDGEQVLLRARIHWVRYLAPAALMLLGVLIGELGLLLSGAASVWLLARIGEALTTELAVTDRKVLAKFGVIRRETIEQQLSRVDSRGWSGGS